MNEHNIVFSVAYLVDEIRYLKQLYHLTDEQCLEVTDLLNKELIKSRKDQKMPTEYKLRYDEDGDIVECVNCNYPAPTEKFLIRLPDSDTVLLCEVCASTLLSNATHYPEQCHDVLLYKAVAWIGNKLLDEIRKQGSDK